MSLPELVNASNWPFIQHNHLLIFSADTTLLNQLQTKCAIDNFWHTTYTSFAAVIVNAQDNKIVAVRDHCGVEPFYYAQSQGLFIFGSTIPDILKAMPIRPSWHSGLPMENLFKHVFTRQEKYTDETYYQSIYRLTPGHELHLALRSNSIEIQKINFWNLQNLVPESIQYRDERDYTAHFTELLQEAIVVHNFDESIGIELSGGLDSSAILLAMSQLNLKPGVVTNIGNEPQHRAEEKFAEKVMQYCELGRIDALDAEEFDLEVSMQRYARCFAGPAPYIDPIINDVLYRTVAKRGYKVLLSGVGGDECVSGHMPIKTCAWPLIKTQGWNAFWKNISSLPHPWLQTVRTLVLAKGHWSEYEYNLLQGAYAHHVRMRVEYKSVAAKHWGFRYAFPLLYPKLIEFCYQLPLAQKRRGAINRWLIRQYLEQQLPLGWLNHHIKTGSIAPAVYAQIMQRHQSGEFQKLFENLPFATQRLQTFNKYKAARHYPFLMDIPAYMFKCAFN